ncbi:MAG: hypothetical protein NT088_02795 [Candidatus Omnitrophica bacterium]|nr:hypothetical protein [Candidatus Omnitrophota bacterium]
MKDHRAQSIAEYAIIMIVVLAAVIAAGFKDNIKNAFQKYFNKASGIISGMKQ